MQRWSVSGVFYHLSKNPSLSTIRRFEKYQELKKNVFLKFFSSIFLKIKKKEQNTLKRKSYIPFFLNRIYIRNTINLSQKKWTRYPPGRYCGIHDSGMLNGIKASSKIFRSFFIIHNGLIVNLGNDLVRKTFDG